MSWLQENRSLDKAKYKRIAFIIVSILCFLFGCRQTGKLEDKKVFPPESFSIIKAVQNEKPFIGSFNMSYGEYKNKEKYPWCLTISVALDTSNLFDNGLPKENESFIANKLEEELLSDIKKLAIAHYVGHLFNDSFLDIYIYLDEPEKANKFLQTRINERGLSREFRFIIKKDPQWSTVNVFLKSK